MSKGIKEAKNSEMLKKYVRYLTIKTSTNAVLCENSSAQEGKHKQGDSKSPETKKMKGRQTRRKRTNA